MFACNEFEGEELDYAHFPIFLDYLIPFAKVADTPCTLDAYLKAKERYHLASQLIKWGISNILAPVNYHCQGAVWD